MKDPIVQALYQKYKGHIAEAKANVDIYLHNPLVSENIQMLSMQSILKYKKYLMFRRQYQYIEKTFQ